MPPQPAAAAGMTESTASGLCYILGFITGILFLVLEPYNKNRNIRFHAFQSIFLNIAVWAVWFVIGILVTVVGSVVGAILPFSLHALFTMVTGLVTMVLGLGIFVGWLYVMIKAFQGSRVVVPFIGPQAEKQANR